MAVKPKFKRSALIEKIDEQSDGTLHVSGFASTEERDSDGEMILASAMSEALPGYMKWGAVREMHRPLAAGTALESSVDTETGKTFIRVHVVDGAACEKVRKGVYKAFSISGPVLERDAVDPTVIKRLKWIETSLVDRPANEGATIDEVVIVKADGLVIEKGMWSVGCLADLLEQLSGLQASAEWEAAAEGDNSPIPAQLKANIAALCETLKGMVAEETAELAADTIAMAAKAAGLEARVAEQNEYIAKTHLQRDGALAELAVLKAAAPADHLAKIEGEKTDLVSKLATATDTIAKLNAKIEKDAADLEIAVKEMKAKGMLRVVEKVNDGRDVPAEDVIKPNDPDAARQAIKKIHASGGKLLMSAGPR